MDIERLCLISFFLIFSFVSKPQEDHAIVHGFA
jgi:hypothetical protein